MPDLTADPYPEMKERCLCRNRHTTTLALTSGKESKEREISGSCERAMDGRTVNP